MKYLVAWVVVLSACYDAPVASPVNTTTETVPIRVAQTAQNKVDLLFMVDNSPSMLAMQQELQNRFGDFLQAFSDLTAQGIYADMHIGVVTSDYGAGHTADPSGGCDASPGGQRGLLQPLGAAAATGCLGPANNARFIQYSFDPAATNNNLPNGDQSVGNLVKTFTCMASVGAAGCGFEHQLESVYAALHNDVENAGFVRDGALLVVVFVTNEDDGSAPPSTDIYTRTATQYGAYETYRQTNFAVACGNPAMLPPDGPSNGLLTLCEPAPDGVGLAYDISRYVDYFRRPRVAGGIKLDPTNDIVLVGIDAPETPFETILADNMSGTGRAPNPAYVACSPQSATCQVRLQHSCQNQAQPAFFGDPAVRLNSFIRSLPQNQITSICGDDPNAPPSYVAALQSAAALIKKALGPPCIPGLVEKPATPDCDVADVTPQPDGSLVVSPIGRCDAQPGVFPCWHAEVQSQCASKSPQSLGVIIERNGAMVPDGTIARVECSVVTAGGGD
jgi:hypothetical protein